MMWNFNNFADNIAAVTDKGEQITYQQLNASSNKIAKIITNNRSVRCLVFCLCSNTIGSLAGYTGFINNCIVPLLLAESLDRELLQHLMQIYRPSFLWLPESMTSDYRSFTNVYTAHGYCLLQTGYEDNTEIYYDLALLLTTSGSTGSPKLVRQSYQNIAANAQAIAEYLELDANQRPITSLPMNYTYGLSVINSHLLVGATLLLTDNTMMQKEFWTFFKEQKASSFGGVPYTYEMLQKLRFTRMQLPYLQTMTQAGGKLAPELHKIFAQYAQDNNKKFIVMYGQTEATARMSYLPAEKALAKVGSMGIAIPGGRFTLLDAKGQEIDKPDIVGELIYEGPNVTLGYAETAFDLKKGDELQGVLPTGDMARRDAEGFYYITGRKKRFLKVYGNRVNLDEIDYLLKQQYPLLDCASSGIDDQVYIFIAGAADQSLQEGIHSFLAGKTGLNPQAFKMITLTVIPRTDTGKICYQELAEYF